MPRAADLRVGGPCPAANTDQDADPRTLLAVKD
jgi:hypothetical protein